MYSIYHFFHSIVQQKYLLKKIKKLDQFPFDNRILSCRNIGVFPDMAIRLNKEKKIFTGGELIELKDSYSYTVSSFNSTIPSRSKHIEEIITGENSIIKHQMEESGNDIFSLPIRDIYYLVRGRRNSLTKVCLVYGSFFETISIDNLISQSFSQVLEERLTEIGSEMSDEFKKVIVSIFSQQRNFSKVRNVEKASVKLRFRIMTEVKSEGNILNARKYPEIKDNTLNLVLPCHTENKEKEAIKKMALVFNKTEMRLFRIFKIKHHFNGYFIVFQLSI